MPLINKTFSMSLAAGTLNVGAITAELAVEPMAAGSFLEDDGITNAAATFKVLSEASGDGSWTYGAGGSAEYTKGLDTGEMHFTYRVMLIDGASDSDERTTTVFVA